MRLVWMSFLVNGIQSKLPFYCYSERIFFAAIGLKLLRDRVLGNEAWLAALLGSLLSVQEYKNSKNVRVRNGSIRWFETFDNSMIRDLEMLSTCLLNFELEMVRTHYLK